MQHKNEKNLTKKYRIYAVREGFIQLQVSKTRCRMMNAELTGKNGRGKIKLKKLKKQWKIIGKYYIIPFSTLAE